MKLNCNKTFEYISNYYNSIIDHNYYKNSIKNDIFLWPNFDNKLEEVNSYMKHSIFKNKLIKAFK